jgi:hypothetical protein
MYSFTPSNPASRKITLLFVPKNSLTESDKGKESSGDTRGNETRIIRGRENVYF